MSKGKIASKTFGLYPEDIARVERLQKLHKANASKIVRVALRLMEQAAEEGVCKPPSASPSPSDASTVAKRSWTVGMDLWRD